MQFQAQGQKLLMKENALLRTSVPPGGFEIIFIIRNVYSVLKLFTGFASAAFYGLKTQPLALR
jgi:hypothetical protein